MNRIETEGIYRAHRVREGTSAKGFWQLVAVKAEGRDRREITLYIRNAPADIREGEFFRVKEIHAITVNAAKDENGEWTRDRMSADVTIKPIMEEQPIDLETFVPGGDIL